MRAHVNRTRALAAAVLLGCAPDSGVLAAESDAAPDPDLSLPARSVGRRGEPSWSWAPAGSTAVTFRLDVRGLQVAPLPEGSVFTLPGQAHAGKPGTPDLPVLAVLQPGAADLAARLVLKPVAWTEITNVDVAPVAVRVPGDITTVVEAGRDERIPDKAIYGRNAFWPASPASMEEAWMGTQKLVRVECRPVQFNPGRRVARYAAVIEGTLVFGPERKGKSP